MLVITALAITLLTVASVSAVSAQFGPILDLSAVGGLARNSGVAIDPIDGTSTVVWDAVVGGAMVQGRQVTEDGQLEAIEDLSLASTVEMHPRVATDPSGAATVVWRRRINATTSIVQARHIAPDGTVGPIIDVSPVAETIGDPDVAVDPAGSAVVVWADSDAGSIFLTNVHARRIAANGALGAVLTPYDGGNPPNFPVDGLPRVGIDALGNATVIWLTANDFLVGTFFVNARRIASDDSLGPIVDVMSLGRASNGGATGRVAVDAAGTATVVVRGDLGAQAVSAISTRRLAPDGSLGTLHSVSDPLGGDCGGAGPPTAVSVADRTTIVWGCFSSVAVDRGVRARQIGSDDQLGPVLTLATDGAGRIIEGVGDDRRPVVFVGAGRVTAAWARDGSSPIQVEARRILSDGRLGHTEPVAGLVGAIREGPQAAVAPTGLTTVTWTNETGGGSTKVIQAAQGWVPIFADVPHGHLFWPWIEALSEAGLTGGCASTPLNYCPDVPVSRSQMAVFLVRGSHGAAFVPPPPTGTMFSDVPASHPFAAWIEQLARDSITSGCAAAPPLYCPSGNVTRAAMAVFLLRAKHGASYTPPPATGTVFNDVPASSPFAAWIEQLALEGITSGCGGGNFCPDNPVTRGQMAKFLSTVLGLHVAS